MTGAWLITEEGYLALGYDKFFHESAPVWSASGKTLTEVVTAAAAWVHDGIEVEADRRALIYYATDETKLELDIEIKAVLS